MAGTIVEGRNVGDNRTLTPAFCIIGSEEKCSRTMDTTVPQSALGIVIARTASHFLSSMFYGIAPSDPYTFVIVLISLVLTTVGACYFTARRAVKVEPLKILRYE